MSHSRYSPSASSRWLRCPGSIQSIESIGSPNRTNEAALEGKFAHKVAEDAFNGEMTKNEAILHFDNKKYSDSGRWTKSKLEHLWTYVDYIRSIRNMIPVSARDKDILVEKVVRFKSLSDKGFGTIDFIAIDDNLKTVHLIDLKFGRGRVVAENNTQLLLYAIGVRDEIIMKRGNPASYTYVLHIVQPRIADGISTWSVRSEHLKNFENIARKAIQEAEMPNPKRVPGETQCRWCEFKNNCPQYAEYSGAVVDELFENLDTDNTEEAHLIKWMSRKPIIMDYLSKIEARFNALGLSINKN